MVIRQAGRTCTDERKIEAFLSKTKTGFLGLIDNETPYVLPLNYVWSNGSIYIHGAAEGRKIDILRNQPNACFTVSEEYGTIADPIPAMTDTAFMSVIVSGTAEFITDLDEATSVMQAMLNKYVPGYYNAPLSKSHVDRYRSSLGSKTLVIKITPEKLTAKEHPLDESMKYYPGRNVQSDL